MPALPVPVLTGAAVGIDSVGNVIRRFLHGKTTTGTASITWAIEPEGRFKGIRFTPVFNGGEAAQGTIEFRADQSRNGNVIASHSLDDFPESVFVPGTTAYVTFEPSDDSQAFDWLLEYDVDTIDFSKLYCRDTQEIVVEGTLSDGSGPQNYSAFTDCRWLITVPEGKVIHFQFDEFETEADRIRSTSSTARELSRKS